MNENSHPLLEQLVQISDQDELRAAIKRHWAKFDIYFLQALWTQTTIAQNDPLLPVVYKRIDASIQDLARQYEQQGTANERGTPSDPYGIVVQLSQSIAHGELGLTAAVEKGIEMISATNRRSLPLQFEKLMSDVEATPLMYHFSSVAELIYGMGRHFPETRNISLYEFAFNCFSLEIRWRRGRGQFVEALQACERLAALAKDNGQREDYCLLLTTLGDICQVQLKPPEFPNHLVRALQYYEEALQVCEDARLGTGIRASILQEMARVLAKQGRPGEGVERLREVLSLLLSDASNNPAIICDCLAELASMCSAAGDYPSAIQCLETAIPLAPSESVRAVLLAFLASLESSQSGEKSEEALSEARRLVEGLPGETTKSGLRGAVYGMLGLHYMRTGNLQGALDAYTLAIADAKSTDDEKSEARWRSNLAQVYMALGQWQDADEAFKISAAVHYREGDLPGAANLLTNYGHLYLGQGEPLRAAALWAEAYVLFHQAQHPAEMGVVAINVGRVYMERGEWALAERCFDYGLMKAEAAHSLRNKLHALSEIAGLQAKKGEVEQAEMSYLQAIDFARQIGEPSGEQELRTEYGRLLEERLNNPLEAAEEYDRAIELQERIRGRFRSVERRMQFQSYSDDATSRIVRLLCRRLHQTGALEKAFRYAERARSRTFAELLSRRQIRYPSSLPSTLSNRENELLARLLGLETADIAGHEIAELYLSLIDELERLWDEISKVDEDCGAYVELRRTPFIKLVDITQLLRP